MLVDLYVDLGVGFVQGLLFGLHYRYFVQRQLIFLVEVAPGFLSVFPALPVNQEFSRLFLFGGHGFGEVDFGDVARVERG